MDVKKLRIIFCMTAFLVVSLIAAVLISVNTQTQQFEHETLQGVLTDKPDYVVYLGGTTEIKLSAVPETAPLSCLVVVPGLSVETTVKDGTIEVTGTAVGFTDVTIWDGSGIFIKIPVWVIGKPVPPGSGLPNYYSDKITIVNNFNPIDKDYVPDLVSPPPEIPKKFASLQAEPDTMMAFEALYNAAFEATGQKLILQSGYRSYQTQADLFNRRVNDLISSGMSREAAKQAVAKTTQPPGKSEHQLGVSMDMGHTTAQEQAFDKTKLGKWVHENAHEYGFILRYPKDKVDITGIDYEPWHFRYVGIGHAEYIFESKICLEEYVNLQKEAEQAAEEYSSQVSAEEYLKLTGR